MTDRDFSQRPFVAGSLIGLRSFSVSRQGRLTGVVQKFPYGPDENLAQCVRGERILNKMLMHLDSPIGEEARRREEQHQLIGLDCSCGFYAYFTGIDPYSSAGSVMFGASSRVTGIIEGYGRTVVGTKGFRAEKARLVAIVFGVEANERLRNLHPIMRVLRGQRPIPFPTHGEWIQIQSHYPDVPLYASLEEALAAHPLTVPDPEVV